jgi:hypothetical protein
MVRLSVTRSNSSWGLLGVGIVGALVNCSSSGSKTGGPSTGNQVGTASGSGGGTSTSSGAPVSGLTGSNGSSGNASVGSMGGGTASSSSGGTRTSGSSGGTSSGTSSGSSGTSGGSSGADGGPSTADGASQTDSAIGGNCMSADITPCTSFTTPTGTTIQLGPYGAQADPNVGKGFENTVNAADSDPQQATCTQFVNSFGEDPALGMKLLTTSMNGITIDFSLYSAYRPVVWPKEKVPVITWGNGTCAQPEGYGALLRYVASYGYFVIAANSRWVGSGTEQMRALDYAAAANMDSSSPYYGKLDMSRVGAMGHSQGGSSTVSAANADSRILDAIVFNASDSGVNKPYLAVSGDMDITGYTASSMASAINGASIAAAYLYYHNPAGMGSLKGHLPLMLSPERVVKPTVAWWEMMFRSDAASKNYFVGATCLLCTMDASTDVGSADYGANTLLK